MNVHERSWCNGCASNRLVQSNARIRKSVTAIDP